MPVSFHFPYLELHPHEKISIVSKWWVGENPTPTPCYWKDIEKILKRYWKDIEKKLKIYWLCQSGEWSRTPLPLISLRQLLSALPDPLPISFASFDLQTSKNFFLCIFKKHFLSRHAKYEQAYTIYKGLAFQKTSSLHNHPREFKDLSERIFICDICNFRRGL